MLPTMPSQSIRRGSLLIVSTLLLLLIFVQSVAAQNADAPSPDIYPLTEEFDNPERLTITDTTKISIEDGKVLVRVQGKGEQYAYRDIPAFSGDVRITVRGQVNEWENNCAVHTGIGDGFKSGVAVSYGFFGGGCPVQGAIVDASLGVRMAHGTNGCDWLGPWLWVEPGQRYEATLTIEDDLVDFSVAGVGSVTGTLQYDGVYSMLYVGDTGASISSNFCSVDIDNVIVEPLAGAILAINDLTATVTYPTQVDLDWTHDIADAANTRIERREAGREWAAIAIVSGDANSFEDNRVTCGMEYEYRADIYTDDDRHTGYSNVIGVSTPECVTILEEDWETGLDAERWFAYGSPAPHVEAGEGRDGSHAFEPNGDGNFHSGVLSNQPFDITSGINVEFWMKGTGPLGEKYSSLIMMLTPCSPEEDVDEDCRQFVALIAGTTERGEATYRALPDGSDRSQEPWQPLDGAWHHYRFRVKPTGLVDFYRDGVLKHASTEPIDFGEHSLLYLNITGKSQNGDWHMDDLRITAPAAPEWHVKVVDEGGAPVADAAVYADGEPLGFTSQAGLIPTEVLTTGLALAAVSALETTSSRRAMHDGWAYITHLTSVERDGDDLLPFTVSGPGEQRLVLKQAYPLILFNLVVSVEWDAPDAYLQQIARAVRLASDHLFDLTDGQMAFGNVDIYSESRHWAEADIQISTKNIARPYAYIGGILEEDTSHIIRVGRAWDGGSGNQGAWDQSEGFRTLAHEFSHYALYLYDEYTAHKLDHAGNVIGEADEVYCPEHADESTADDTVRASAMDDSYRATEFSARDVSGLWSSACERTLHYQQTQQSPWETIVDAYSDQADPPRWRMISPIDRGSVLAGPNEIPSFLPGWPTVQVHMGEDPASPRNLTVFAPGKVPAANALVALYRHASGVPVIGQGMTDDNGRILVYGASEGDTIRATSIDGGVAGDIYVSTASNLELTMQSVATLAAQNAAFAPLRAIPHMRVIAEPRAASGQVDLLLTLHNFGADVDLGVSLSTPGDLDGYAPVMGYSPVTGVYSGRLAFAATEEGMGRVRVFGSMPASRVRMHATYRLQRVRNDSFGEVYSNDGNFHLQLDANSLPADEAYFVVMPPGAIPGPLPTGMTLLGDPYDVTASGALAVLEKPAALTTHFDQHLLPDGVISTEIAAEMDIYRWDAREGEWMALGAKLNTEQGALVIPIRALGVYAILVPGESGSTDEVDSALRGTGG